MKGCVRSRKCTKRVNTADILPVWCVTVLYCMNFVYNIADSKKHQFEKLLYIGEGIILLPQPLIRKTKCIYIYIYVIEEFFFFTKCVRKFRVTKS